ncbi:MAG: hypothetical protein JWN43_4416 [Gammaproteobacteria bacterium]|nr:hypothetical protein [Gammaproteobacteria bacterium]
MSATVVAAPDLRSEGRYFYLYMAGAFLLVAFGGFIPSYWAPVVAGSFRAPPIIHIHGMLLFTWTTFYFVQTSLVAARRTMDHRAWGLAGISLFSMLMCSILVAVSVVLRHDEALGVGDAGRRFAAVTLCGWPVLAGLFTLAIVNIRRPEFHKRFMTLAMSAMMTPALARVFIALFAPPGAAGNGPPPPFVSVPPALCADIFIVVAMVHDWRTRGRPHPVYIWGGLVVLAQQVLTVPFAATATWMNIAKAFQSLSG